MPCSVGAGEAQVPGCEAEEATEEGAGAEEGRGGKEEAIDE